MADDISEKNISEVQGIHAPIMVGETMTNMKTILPSNEKNTLSDNFFDFHVFA